VAQNICARRGLNIDGRAPVGMTAMRSAREFASGSRNRRAGSSAWVA
jgi:hypothetical protein